VYDALSARENLMIAARTTTGPAQARERVEGVLSRLSLDGLADEPAAALLRG
jgi:branched-chain amino acid transport system ATP-binding protein